MKRYWLHVFLLCVFMVIAFIGYSGLTHRETYFSTREPAVSGSFYPAGEKELSGFVNASFASSNSSLPAGRITGLISPHAGYMYSGRTAAAGFSQIKGRKIKTVIILAPSHYYYFRGAALANYTHFRTPLGPVKLSPKNTKLAAEALFSYNNTVHEKEHSVEVQLPFLQSVAKDAEIIPVIIGAGTSLEDAEEISRSLSRIADDETLVIASSDFTHYGPDYGYVPFTDNVQENLRAADYASASYVVRRDTRGFYHHVLATGDTICGFLPVTILSGMLGNRTEGKVLSYETSGAITEDNTNSVSYFSIAFVRPYITEDEKAMLSRIARDSIAGRQTETDTSLLPEALKEKKGCFVTLTEKGSLRGCIGQILPQEELYKCVRDNAFSAAFNDPRFIPLNADEMDDIEIEVSVLTVPERAIFSGPEEILSMLQPGIDGVVLKSGPRQSTFLPQVWEQMPSKEVFLTELCIKGGMGRDCWKEKSTEVYVYQAEAWEEPDHD